MKRVLYIVSFLLIAVSGFAETMVTRTCEALRKTMGYPYYYCYCKEESETFQFPLDRIVRHNVVRCQHERPKAWYIGILVCRLCRYDRSLCLLQQQDTDYLHNRWGKPHDF